MHLLSIVSIALLQWSFVIFAFADGQSSCCQGPPGQPGTPGTPGIPGNPGTPGTSAYCGCGQSGAGNSRRWKQCAWVHDNTKDGRDNGKVHECDFVKLRDDSYLRVVYMGNIRITGCTACCKRWFFTFNGAECKVPAPIDGSLYQSVNINVHRPTSIEGYCGGIAAGKVRVGFSVGNCGVPLNTNGDAYTGSNQANRVIIEEVEPPVG